MVLTRSSARKDSARQPEESSSKAAKRSKVDDGSADSFPEDHVVSMYSQAVHVLSSVCRIGCCQVQTCMLDGCLSAYDRHLVAAAMAAGVRLYWRRRLIAGR